MNKIIKLCCVLFFSTFLLAACETQDKKAGGEADEKVDGTVVATVGDASITLEELKSKFSGIPPQFMGLFEGEEGKKRFLDEIIKEKVFIAEAKRLGIDKRPEVSQTIRDMKDNIIVKSLYDIKTKEFNTNVNITDEDVDNELKLNNIASASHILIKDEKKAKEVLAKVQKSGSLEKLAEEYSEDPSAKRNKGNLGNFERGQMVPEFENAVFNMKVGEISKELIKSDFGFHIIKRTQPEKEDIKGSLYRKRQQEYFESWLTQIKNATNVNIKEDVLKNFELKSAQEMSGMPQGHPVTPEGDAAGAHGAIPPVAK